MTQEVSALHKTTNITEWIKTAIKEHLLSKGYSIAMFNVECEIMTRMGKITIMNNLNLKIVDENGNDFTIEGYNNTNKEYDDLRLKWLVDFIKEKEAEALINFSKNAEVEKPTDLQVEFEVSGKKIHEDFKFYVMFNSNVKDLISFMVDAKYQLMWGGASAKVDGNDLMFENITLKDIKVVNGDSIEMSYMWNDWKELSRVKIDFLQVGDNVKVTVSQKYVPVGLKDNVKAHWKSNIFYPISVIFRCPLRQSS